MSVMEDLEAMDWADVLAEEAVGAGAGAGVGAALGDPDELSQGHATLAGARPPAATGLAPGDAHGDGGALPALLRYKSLDAHLGAPLVLTAADEKPVAADGCLAVDAFTCAWGDADASVMPCHDLAPAAAPALAESTAIKTEEVEDVAFVGPACDAKARPDSVVRVTRASTRRSACTTPIYAGRVSEKKSDAIEGQHAEAEESDAPPRANAVSTAENAKGITADQLRAAMHRPLTEVAKEFGLGRTTFKDLCRKMGIAKWPHRQIKSLDEINCGINHTKAALDRQLKRIAPSVETEARIMHVRRQLSELDANAALVAKTRRRLLANPSYTVPASVVRLRQWEHKRRYLLCCLLNGRVAQAA